MKSIRCLLEWHSFAPLRSESTRYAVVYTMKCRRCGILRTRIWTTGGPL